LILKEPQTLQSAAELAPDSKRVLIERLFAAHGQALQAFFRRRIRSKTEAPDLAQEVYVRMLRVSNTDAIRNPELYLYTVAGNLLKEHAVLERRFASAIEVDNASLPPELVELPGFDGLLDTNQRVARLKDVLGQLPPNCRAAVVLQYRHGMSYEEIAKHLGVSHHAVKKYLTQALVHCRRRMARLG
jgi:RNA polymerase sigma-70 factor (ECF subfamily)